MHDATVETHIDLLARQVHVGIFHMGITIEMSRLGVGIIDQRVTCLIRHGSINTSSLRTEDAVFADRIIYCLVMQIDSQLQRVHAQRIVLYRSFRLKRVMCNGIIVNQSVRHDFGFFVSFRRRTARTNFRPIILFQKPT